MNNIIIYLIGFPGTGKYTIAKEICQRAAFKLVDNHLINNALFSLIKKDGKTPLPGAIWDNIGKIWDAVLDTIIHISPRDYSFVLTNALTDQGTTDGPWFERVKNGAEERQSLFIPVRLSCSVEEMERRIIQPDRITRMKETDPQSPKRNFENFTVLSVDHPNLLDLDITSLSPEEAARVILDHARNLS